MSWLCVASRRPNRGFRFVSDDEIPTAIEGDGPSQRRQRYAELLAAQVRLAYPVAALAHDVREGRVPTDQKI
jgi:hypothetical protein